MSLHIPTFADPASLAAEQRREELAFKQQAYIDEKTRAAEAGEQKPQIIVPGMNQNQIVQTRSMIDGSVRSKVSNAAAESMSWDFSPGWEDRRIKQIRALKAAGKPFRPAARMVHSDGGVENVYPYGHVDLRWFEKGLCCVRCANWKHDDPKDHAAQHAKLRQHVTIEPPAGVPIEDMCGYCGNRLDLQKFNHDDAGEAA